MEIHATITGGAEAIEGFRDVSNQVRRGALRDAFRKGGRPIQKEAKVLVPKDDRDLERAIGTSVSAKDTSVKVDIGVRLRRPGGPARYAHLVEETGNAHSAPQPFLRPALDNKGAEAVRVIADDLGPALERSARKAHRRALAAAAKRAGR